jgi:hypothetical protein
MHPRRRIGCLISIIIVLVTAARPSAAAAQHSSVVQLAGSGQCCGAVAVRAYLLARRREGGAPQLHRDRRPEQRSSSSSNTRLFRHHVVLAAACHATACERFANAARGGQCGACSATDRFDYQRLAAQKVTGQLAATRGSRHDRGDAACSQISGGGETCWGGQARHGETSHETGRRSYFYAMSAAV